MAFNLLVNGLDCGTLCFVEDRPLHVYDIKVNVIKRLIGEVSVLKFSIISRLTGVYVYMYLLIYCPVDFRVTKMLDVTLNYIQKVFFSKMMTRLNQIMIKTSFLLKLLVVFLEEKAVSIVTMP